MRTSPPALCIDIDNVIGQTDEVMRRVISEYTGGRVQLAYEDIKVFNYHECRDCHGNGIDEKDWTTVHDLFSEPRYLLEIEPLPGAIDSLRQLMRAATLHVATSRLRKARPATVEWLDKHEVPDHYLHFVKHNQKHACLRGVIAAVEDDYEQAVDFAKSGITCFLIGHPWNASRPKIEGVEWADSWGELTSRLLAMIRGGG